MTEALSHIQWLVISLAALCIGMSKTGVQGIMLMIVPLMAMAFGAKESTGVILPMLCMADIIAVAYYKRIADWKAASKREQSEACFDYAERKQLGSEIKVVAKLLPTAILGFFLAIGVDNMILSY